MANAVGRVSGSKTYYDDTGIDRTLADVTATYQIGSMIALNGSGLAVKCDDTAGIRFDGLLMGSIAKVVTSGDAAIDRKIHTEKPRLFVAKIASATDADIGRKVYAKYDDEVAFTGVNSVLIGTVERVPNATNVEIMPYWVSTSGVNAFDGATLTFTGATGGNVVAVPDNLADGLSISQGANPYLTFVTTNGAERILATKNQSFLDSVGTMFGTGEDIVVSWDGTRLNVTQATVNSEIRWGVDGAGIDQRWYGDTASASMLWDQSADKLIFGGVAKIQLQTIAAATGTAIPVTHSGSFPITQNGAETNTLADPTFLGQQLDIFVDTDTSGARVITAASRINQAANTIITLTEVGDFIRLVAITIAGALKWQVVANDGAALS